MSSRIALGPFSSWGEGLGRGRPIRVAMGADRVAALSLPAVEIAIARVAARVAQGGHDVPETAIRRRFRSGIDNFHRLYRPLADAWALYDNSGAAPVLLEWGEHE